MGHLAATTYTVSGGGGGFAVYLFIGIAFYVLTALGLYGTFVKAGQPGWAGFVPFYNFIILLNRRLTETWDIDPPTRSDQGFVVGFCSSPLVAV